MSEISVIIPLLNKGQYIRRAIDSIFAQDYQNFEIIVVEGGSTDKGPDIVKSIRDPRLSLITQPTKGVSEARNFGVELSQGSLIAFLDADDEWLPDHLKTIMRLREKYPQAGAYTTAYKICIQNGKLRWPKYRAIPPAPWEGLLPSYFSSAAKGEFPVWTSAVCIPKKIYTDMGGFPLNAWWGEDADLWGKIALEYPIAFSWEIGAIYHWDASDRVCGKPVVDVEPFVITGREKLKTSQMDEFVRKDLEEYIARKELYRAASHLFIGNIHQARDILMNTHTKYYKMRKILLFSLSFMPQFIIRSVLGRFFIDPC